MLSAIPSFTCKFESRKFGKMGYIKEPDGVDFIINGKPLTDKEKRLSVLLSKQIKKLQNKNFENQEAITNLSKVFNANFLSDKKNFLLITEKELS